MGKRPSTAIVGFGIGLIMWILGVADVNLPIPLLIILGIVAFGMVVYGSIPILVCALNGVRKLRIRNPIIFERNEIKPSSGKAPQSLQEKLSQEQVAERLAFIQQSRVVSERLFKNSQGAENRSIYSIVRNICGEAPVREYIAEDGLAGQTVRLLTRQLDDLFSRTSSYHRYTEELSVSSLDDAVIRSVCNTARELVLDYRRLVDESMEILKNMGERGVKNLWDEVPWAARIHRGFADNYDELMRLVIDLRGITPKSYKEILPNDDQLSKFPRAFLLS